MGKEGKQGFFELEQDGELIKGQENLKVFITKYYKEIFQMNDIPQI